MAVCRSVENFYSFGDVVVAVVLYCVFLAKEFNCCDIVQNPAVMLINLS